MRGHWLLRMVSRIFHARDGLGLGSLTRVGEFLDALVGRIRRLGQSLCVARLTSAIGSNLPGVGPDFIHSGINLRFVTCHDNLPSCARGTAGHLEFRLQRRLAQGPLPL